MENYPKVSIITVCLNSKDCLEDAIKSVCEQTYPNIEYIIVDGGSTDGGIEIFNKYRDRIDKLLIEPDKGIFDAMNKGIRLASGEIIYFLNSDDRCYNARMIEKAVSVFLKNRDADFIYGDLAVIDPIAGISYIERYPEKISKWLFVRKTITQQATLFRSSCFQKVGYFNDTYRIVSDYEWYLKAIFIKGLKGVHVKEIISFFTVGGISTNYEHMGLYLYEKSLVQKKYFGMPEILFAMFFCGIRKSLRKEAVYFLHNIRVKLFKRRIGVDIRKESKSGAPLFRKDIRTYISNVFYKNEISNQYSKDGLRVLHYHSISDEFVKNGYAEETTPKGLFYNHMKYLFDNKYNVIRCQKGIEYLISKQRMPPKTIAITFDDGYRDNYTNALPILEKYNFPATIFITLNFLRECSNKKEYLSCDELMGIKNSGIIDIGCHGATHRTLSTLNAMLLNKEIKEAKKRLEDIINDKVEIFAYPFGHRRSYNRLVIDMIKMAGFKGALTSEFGFNDYRTDLFKIKRNRISWLDELSEFEKHLFGAYDWYRLVQSLQTSLFLDMNF